MISVEEQIAPSVFADPSVLNLTLRQSEKVLPLLLEFLVKYRSRVGSILMGLDHGSWTNADLRRLENIILEREPDPQAARDFLRVARKACAYYVARERVDLAFPRIPVVLPEPKNPFHLNVPRMLRGFAGWKALLTVWLKERVKVGHAGHQEAADPTIEMLLVSAVLYGGLHNIASLVALIRAIPELPARTIVVDGRMHIELSLSWRGVEDMEFRRWQPDPLTATLWSRIRPEQANDLLRPEASNAPDAQASDRVITARIHGLLRDALNDRSVRDKHLLRSLHQLLRMAQTVAHIELPAILATYSSRKLVSHSLQRDALRRLVEGVIPNAADPVFQNTPGPRLRESLPHTSEDLESSWLVTLRGLLNGKDHKSIRAELAARVSRGDLTPFVHRIVDFADSLLAVRSRGGRLLSTATVSEITLRIARHMGCFLDDRDPAELSAESLESIYIQMIESISPPVETQTATRMPGSAPRARSDLARALMEFHRYMMARCNKSAIEDQGFLMAEAGLVVVDANIVSLEQYYAVLGAIESSWPATDYPERKQIATILVILGFRCGLRRLEALRLPAKDILSGPTVELLIRPGEMRGLKSRNAIRRIPLGMLLTENELQKIEAWRNARGLRGSTGSTHFLFGNEREQLDVVPQSIFEQINHILRGVTGDPTMHFHHLRHSFATWTWLRLMLADLSDPPDLFPHLEKTTAWLRDGKAFRKKSYRSGMPTRKHTFMLAQLLGHGSPATSMEHYVHMADWLLYLYLQRSPMMRPRDALIALASGRPRQTTKRWRSNCDSMAIPLRLWEKRRLKQSRLSDPESAKNPAPKTMKPAWLQSVQQVDWVRRTYDFLYVAETSGRPLDEVARQYGFDEARSHAILERARYLRDLPSGNADRRHRLESFTPDHRVLGERKTLLCPRRPIHARDQTIVARFSPRFEALTRGEPALLHPALRCYVHQVWNSRDRVVFHNHAEADNALNYLECLMRLGILRKELRWFSFSNKKRSKDLAEWKRLLKLNRHDKIERLKAPNRESNAAEAWLGIAPRFYDSDDLKSSANPGSFGFRFVMLMGFLAFGGPKN